MSDIAWKRANRAWQRQETAKKRRGEVGDSSAAELAAKPAPPTPPAPPAPPALTYAKLAAKGLAEANADGLAEETALRTAYAKGWISEGRMGELGIQIDPPGVMSEPASGSA